ncbi:MAG TPA: UDP-N-acetylmuramoyl-L-alanine--D-glutamate ligase [Acidimicrobiales bacterium]|nr:UDP-N-acetylmuramoyl-L-alanine--D-glutamate ligase [Acidimicrobiales bacterium]
MPELALVVGLGRSGAAVARHLRDRGGKVVAVDDAPGEEARGEADRLGIELRAAPDEETLARLVADADVVVPSPGVPEHHPVFQLASAAGVPVRSEVELAFRWSRRPIVAVTGTNGKTTVTALVTDMLVASGVKAAAGGNIGVPLSDAVRRDVDVVVAEVSSFQLRWTDTFRPSVAVWLNLAEDHLDWHADLASYVAAKARIWANQGKGDVAIANADDPVVMKEAARVRSRLETFGLERPADWRVLGGVLQGPVGRMLPVAELPRARPHDLANALAASAAAVAVGARRDGVRAALRAFEGLPHRLTLVAEAGGVRWYDDSKATNPHAALAAVSGFDSVVLVAGGRNKGLDLGVLARRADRLRAVVAVGEAAPEVEEAFADIRPVARAADMDEAVRAAAAAARPGDVVLLAPGCASFDRYGSYAERGADFARAVGQVLGLAANGNDRDARG